MSTIDERLVRDVDLLCLDAGNTVIFLDHALLADIVKSATGRVVVPSVLERTEGEAKRLAETNGLCDADWAYRGRPGAVAWGKMIATTVLRAGVIEAEVPLVLEHAWRVHEVQNLWRKVPEGLGAALDDLRRAGTKVAVISNSEGMLQRLFRDLDIARHFDLLVDSGVAGVEKPDPRIFAIALDRFVVPKERALHLGDMFATDIVGARNAGIRSALIDPFGHYEGRHLDVPRVPGATETARAIRIARSGF